jgi:uncharacterized membrane protein YdbT with pleckstrin-like domain
MRYIHQILQPGERLVHTATVHWIVYVPGFAVLVLALLATVWAGHMLSDWARLAAFVLAALLAAAGVILVVLGWLKRFSTEIDVTDRRIVYKRGLFRRHTVEMNMDKVATVDVDQSVLGRILDYGDVTVQGTGFALERVPLIQGPLAFRNHVTAR